MNALAVESERQLLACFDEVLDAPASERLALVRSRFGSDEKLVHDLEQLIAAAERTDTTCLADSVDVVLEPVLTDLADHSVTQAEIPTALVQALAPRYTILERIGRGGMASVYLAFDTPLGRHVAIKAMRPELADGIGLERFAREIAIAATVDHPRIVPVYDRGDANGQLYYVMRYVEGGSLRDLLLERPQLEIRRAIEIARDVAEALDAAHARKVVHRDIKPANILLDERGAHVADFGVARLIDAAGPERLTRSGIALGTALYMSPEQAGSSTSVDGRSDVYALACVLYEMLAGEAPFNGPTQRDIVAKHLAAAIPDLTVVRATITRPMQQVIATALQKSRADRFASAGEFINAFERAYLAPDDALLPADGRPTHAIGVVSAAPASRIRLRRALLVTIAAALTLLTVLSAAPDLRARAGRLLFAPPARPAHDSLRLVVAIAEVKHDPADASLATSFADAVVAELRRDPWIVAFTPEAFRKAAELYGFSAATLTRDTIEFLSRRTRMSALVTLGVSRAGSGLVFSAEAVGAANDYRVGAMTRAVAGAADVPKALERMATDLRHRIVAARDSLPHSRHSDGNPLVDQVAPLALQLYLQGEAEYSKNPAEAARLFGAAVRADSNFAAAWYKLSGALGFAEASRQEQMTALSAAYSLRDKLRSPVDRLVLSGNYWRIMNFPQRAAAALDSFAMLTGHVYPNQAYVYTMLRQYDLAERRYRSRIDTTSRQLVVENRMLVWQLLQQGKLSEAREELARMARIDSTSILFRRTRWDVLLSTRAWDEVERDVADLWRKARSADDTARVLSVDLIVSRVQGRIARQDSLQLLWPSSAQFSAAVLLQSELERAILHAIVLTDSARARGIMDSALATTAWHALPALDRPYSSLLFLLASLGDRTRAQAIVLEWSRSIPFEFKMIDSLALLAGQGELALASGQAREGLRLFQLADPWGYCPEQAFPRYARAYDRLAIRDSAILWYERHVTRNQCPIGQLTDALELARAYRRLGELYEERGNWRGAMHQYQKFVALWRNADPPLQSSVRDVDARIARLRVRIK